MQDGVKSILFINTWTKLPEGKEMKPISFFVKSQNISGQHKKLAKNRIAYINRWHKT